MTDATTILAQGEVRIVTDVSGPYKVSLSRDRLQVIAAVRVKIVVAPWVRGMG